MSICKHCAYEADMVSQPSVNPEQRDKLHDRYRMAKMGHVQCEGCDCQHKNVGTCIPVEGT
jgi:hypothetical protein